MTAYHVEYGQMRHIGRFTAETPELPFGQMVVVESNRGVELGRVVAPAPDDSTSTHPKILRAATEQDLTRASELEATRNSRFDACRKIFEDGVWPIEPIDVEPLLDGERAVLYYFGPHQLDVSGLIGLLRQSCGVLFVFEPVGNDVSDDEPVDDHSDADHGCGSCSSDGSCGSNGGGCGSSEGGHGGCSTCAVSDLVAKRRRTAGPAV